MTTSAEPVETQVLIVGGGPVGLACSIDLSYRGIPHLLIDEGTQQARSVHPRMDQVGVRSMEFLRRWGVTAEVEAAGFPRTLQRDIVFKTAMLGYELEREPVICDGDRAPPPVSPQKHELCPQNFFDPVLQKISQRSRVAQTLYETRLLDFDQSVDAVEASLEDVQTGRKWRVTAQYLVGCDGANSRVAQKLGIGAAEQATLACSTNIFIESEELTRLMAERPGYRYILMEPAGVWASMVNMDGRSLWRLQILGGANWREWSEQEAHEALARALGRPVAYTLKSIVPWARRELVVDHFRKGRCFVAGDAAHQLSPTGGYGMNTGIGEALDLAWKLAAVIKGWGGPALLDSYEAERRPVAVRNAARGTVNFKRMTGVHGDEHLLDADENGRRVRDRVGHDIRAATSEEWDSLGIHLGYEYSSSPVICYDGEIARDDPANYIQSSRPGARAPHAWLSDGRSTLDLFGPAFTLLVFGDVTPDALIDAATTRGLPLSVERIDQPEIASLYEKPLVLVRPDGHVAWRGDAVGDEAVDLIDLVRGAAEGTSAQRLQEKVVASGNNDLRPEAVTTSRQ